MIITRKRFVVMRNSRSEVWCGLSKHFYFKPISEVKDTSIKTYRSQAQAEAGCSSWDRNFEVVPATETIVVDPMTNADKIRAMSDEELCKLLMAIPDVPCEQNGYLEKCNLKCEECIMKWLQQPEEGE